MGDTQMTGNPDSEEDKASIAVLEKLGDLAEKQGRQIDFGLQTGDYVDNGSNYAMWTEMQNAFYRCVPGRETSSIRSAITSIMVTPAASISAASAPAPGQGLLFRGVWRCLCCRHQQRRRPECSLRMAQAGRGAEHLHVEDSVHPPAAVLYQCKKRQQRAVP